jgi:hypothetical protein
VVNKACDVIKPETEMEVEQQTAPEEPSSQNIFDHQTGKAAFTRAYFTTFLSSKTYSKAASMYLT